MRLKLDGYIIWPVITFAWLFCLAHMGIATDKQHLGIFVGKWLNNLRWPFDNTGVMLIGEDYLWLLYVAYVVFGVLSFLASGYAVKKSWQET